MAHDIFSKGEIVAERYRIVSLIGRGGMGCIYEVMQLSPQKSQAMKVLFSHASSDGALRRFQQEAQALRKLEHPNIVKATDCGVLHDGQPFFVMDLVDGETLSHNLEAYGAWDTPEAVRLFASLADAFECAHKQGVVHRDINQATSCWSVRTTIQKTDTLLR